MRFADAADHLAHRHQVFLELEVPVTADPLEVDQTVAYTVDTFLHEAVGKLAVGFVLERPGVDVQHVRFDLRQRVAPGPVVVRAGIQRIDTGCAGFLVLQQHVGDAAIGGDDKDAVVEVFTATLADQDIVEHRIDIRHRCAADLVNSVYSVRHRQAPLRSTCMRRRHRELRGR